MRFIKSKKVFEQLKADFNLGNGEAETLALAVSQKEKLVAIDDRRGIKVCKLLKTPFTTAVAITVRMYEKRLLSREQALAKLDALARHGRYSKEIISKAKAEVEAKK